MNFHDLITVAATIVVSLGGGGAIVYWFASLIGKILADKYIEKVKQEFQQELESHKARLRKSEFLFQKEFEAASAFISLRLRLMPRYRFAEMIWDDACQEFAHSFGGVGESIGRLYRHPRCRVTDRDAKPRGQCQDESLVGQVRS